MRLVLTEQLRRIAGLLVLTLGFNFFPNSANAQNTITIDATASAPAPSPVLAALGTSRNPQGDTIGVNSQYLTRNGKPWLPVMGEFHFSRYPEAQWEQELLKMKAAGVNIVSTYIIWIHHEQNEGEFNWSGQRDLRRFVELCGRHGLYVVVRIGPWAHAEARNGGLPDWVLKNSAVRQNDPVYLKEVGTFYTQIAKQLQNELWKDGGPVIGVQIENEYNATGPGKGEEHIRTLKKMAVDAGLDVPLYTVTGWDAAAIPLDSVLPVYGGYPDAPWAGTPGPMPPNEIYAFRFQNRAAGNMGAIGGHGQNPASSYQGTPFLTAEVGDGIENTYFRRPVVSPDDVAAIAPVMLGSGANLLGYYMFHGGRNPEGGTITLQESQRTGYPTDVPVRSYDFQAPLGEFGQERESLRKLKLVHYFLNDFGSALAPMAVHSPETLPTSAADTTVPRVAARTSGGAGFVFFNNHLRGKTMPDRPNFQIRLNLPRQELRIPERPIDLPADAYGIWPVNLPVGGTTLRYSTAQLFKRVTTKGRTFYWFFAIPGVQPEFSLPVHTPIVSTSHSVQRTDVADGILLRTPSDSPARIELKDGATLVVLPERQAEQIWRVDDPSLLLQTPADAFSDHGSWTLESDGTPRFSFGVFGATAAPATQVGTLKQDLHDELFQRFTIEVPSVMLTPDVKEIRTAETRPPWTLGPVLSWRSQQVPMAPAEAEFEDAAMWQIHLPAIPLTSTLSDVFLSIAYQGDVARLILGTQLVDDNFWNGLPWSIGLRETDLANPTTATQLELQILPLPQKFPMYIEDASQLHFTAGAADALSSVRLVPQYRVVLQQPTKPLMR